MPPFDPPSLPQKPYFPNRLYFCLGGLAFGLTLGLAIVVISEVVSPRLYSEEELSAIVEAPIFVTIPPLPTPAENLKRLRYRALEWVIATAMLIVIPTVSFLIYRKG